MNSDSSIRCSARALTVLFRPETSHIEEGRFVALRGGKVRVQNKVGGDCVDVMHREVEERNNLLVAVAIIGFCKVTAGGRVADGDEIISDALGRGITDPQTPGAPVHIVGIARTGAVEGQSFRLEIRKYKLHPPAAAAQYPGDSR